LSQRKAKTLINKRYILYKTLALIDVLYRTRQPVDSTDRQLLSLLRDDARLSVAALAKTLRVARGTVQNRKPRISAFAR
jgi:hypothetical protein